MQNYLYLYYDAGLACSLLGLEDVSQLTTYYKKGDLFENLIINELLKNKEDFSFLIYTGEIMQKTKFGNLVSWKNLNDI